MQQMLKGVCCKVWCIWFEKRDPIYHQNFKAVAMNASIRVSSNISNGQVLLNLDCDMYSNNSQATRDALCFLMDEPQFRKRY